MFCPSCKEKLPDDTMHCPVCRQRLDASSKVSIAKAIARHARKLRLGAAQTKTTATDLQPAAKKPGSTSLVGFGRIHQSEHDEEEKAENVQTALIGIILCVVAVWMAKDNTVLVVLHGVIFLGFLALFHRILNNRGHWLIYVGAALLALNFMAIAGESPDPIEDKFYRWHRLEWEARTSKAALALLVAGILSYYFHKRWHQLHPKVPPQ